MRYIGTIKDKIRFKNALQRSIGMTAIDRALIMVGYSIHHPRKKLLKSDVASYSIIRNKSLYIIRVGVAHDAVLLYGRRFFDADCTIYYRDTIETQIKKAMDFLNDTVGMEYIAPSIRAEKIKSIMNR